MSYYPKTAILPLCSIYRHVGHDGWSAGSSDIIFKGNPQMMIQAKFGLTWPSGFRGEIFFKKVYRRTTDEWRQVIGSYELIRITQLNSNKCLQITDNTIVCLLNKDPIETNFLISSHSYHCEYLNIYLMCTLCYNMYICSIILSGFINVWSNNIEM